MAIKKSVILLMAIVVVLFSCMIFVEAGPYSCSCNDGPNGRNPAGCLMRNEEGFDEWCRSEGASRKCLCSVKHIGGAEKRFPPGCILTREPGFDEWCREYDKQFPSVCPCRDEANGGRTPSNCKMPKEEGFEEWCKTQDSSQSCSCSLKHIGGNEKREPEGCVLTREEGFDSWCKSRTKMLQ